MLYILSADIGGTNCRLALFSHDSNKITMVKLCTLPTASMSTTSDLAKAYVGYILNANILDRQIPIVLSIAFAGNITGQSYAKLTNAKLCIDIDDLKNMLGVQYGYLLNDFVAQACSFCVYDIYNYVSVILESNSDKRDERNFLGDTHSLMSIIGAGTGLGIATLLSFDKENTLAMPSECGHSAFPFVGLFEYELSEFIKEKLNVPYACCEHILSGRGLSLLYEFLTGKVYSAQYICTNYLTGDILHYFSMFLGRMCRNLALTTLCTGGVYLTGGVVAKNPVIAHHPSFKEEFYLSPAYSQWLRNVPVYLNTNESSGLWGAAYAGIMYYKQSKVPV